MKKERSYRRVAAGGGCPASGTEREHSPALVRLALGTPLRRFALLSVFAASALCATGPTAGAQVLCTSPDDLCVGNPCVTDDVEVATPCVLDFGTRNLTIGGKLRVPNGGVLQLRARSIFVEQPILGRHTEVHDGDGAFVTLIATDTISVDRRIDVSASETPGKISLSGTNVWVRGSLRAKSKGEDATAAGGEVTATAARNMSTSGSGPIDVRGGATSPGGTVSLSASTGAILRKAIDARGHSGGSVTVNGGAGSVEVGHTIEVDGKKADGGSINLSANLDIRILKKVVANGRTQGGSISMTGRTVTASSPVRVRSSMGPGGTLSLSAVQLVTLNKELSATGTAGGAIEVGSQGNVTMAGMVDVTGRRTSGGSLVVTAGNDITHDGFVEADGATAGGNIDLTAVDMVRLTKRAHIFAEGDSGGFVDILGGSANVEEGADLEVDGVSVGGEVRITATSGNLVLSGQFRARGDTGGVIEGMATGDVTANGDFQSRTAGCTGLSAGGSLDTTDGVFDGPVEDTCN
jgi:hypothetical protein